MPTPTGSSIRLTVIVPVRNGALQLPRCLDALCNAAYDNYEVIVVDDGSTEQTMEIARRFGLEPLSTGQTMGPGGARNLGARRATGQVLVFVDADVVIAPNVLGLIARDFQRDAELGAVFGSYDDAPAWNDFLSQYKNLMHHYVHQVSSEQAVTFWAGCGAIRKDVFEKYGGYNAEKYRLPSIEDIELGYRMTQGGERILLDKEIQAKHLKRWTWRGLLRADIFYRAIPWTRLILTTRNLPRDLNLTLGARLSASLVGLLLVSLLALAAGAAGVSFGVPLAALAAVPVALIVVLLALNWPVYAWFARKRGVWFATRAVPAHWFYYFYSAAVFGACAVVHAVQKFFAAVLRGIGMGPAAARE